jgi:hypothetical protein
VTNGISSNNTNASAKTLNALVAIENGAKPTRIVKRSKRSWRYDDGATRLPMVRPSEGKRPRVADRWSFTDELNADSLETFQSWGYVAPGGVVVNYTDGFTIGVVVGSGAEKEQPELPRYIFRWDTEYRNYTIVRDFGLALARRFMRRFWRRVRGVSLMRGDCVAVETGYYDEVEFVRFDHIASKEEFREWLKQFN